MRLSYQNLPRYPIQKTVKDADISALFEFVPWIGFLFLARPARLEIMPPGNVGRVTVCEGKFHQVKRMFLACGRTVTHLKRLTFGGVRLDETLAPGQWRELTAQEMKTLRAAAEGNENG